MCARSDLVTIYARASTGDAPETRAPRAVATSSPSGGSGGSGGGNGYVLCELHRSKARFPVFTSGKRVYAVKRIPRREISAPRRAANDTLSQTLRLRRLTHRVTATCSRCIRLACGILKFIAAARVTSRTRCRGSSARKREPPIEVSDQVRLTPSIPVKAAAYCCFLLLHIFVRSPNFTESFIKKFFALQIHLSFSDLFLSSKTRISKFNSTALVRIWCAY